MRGPVAYWPADGLGALMVRAACWPCALLWLTAVLPFALPANVVTAQEFRVYTRVLQAPPGQTTVDARTPLARSTTLFHAGKAYDYLDSSGEITIFEPAHERFLMLSPSRLQRTVVPFSEIETRLHQASARADQFLKEVRSGDRTEGQDLAALIETQLRPKLTESLSADGKLLRLESPALRYEATLARSGDAAVVAAYARYVDWTAKLNFVLHPKSNPPAARLVLNAALVRHQAFPMTVRLEVLQGPQAVREAIHQFEWKLGGADRKQIQQWEKLVTDKSLKSVEFEEFRRGK